MVHRVKHKRPILSPLLASLRLREVGRHIREGSSVLDCGCGLGMTRRWLPPGCRYVGFDINEEVIRKNQETQAATDLFLCASWENLPLPEHVKFDVVVMAAFLEHFPEPAQVVQHIAEYLGEGGQLIITTPSPGTARLYAVGATLGLFSTHAVREHKKLLNREDLVQIAQDAGLELKTYYRFELGCNQLCILVKTQHQQP